VRAGHCLHVPARSGSGCGREGSVLAAASSGQEPYYAFRHGDFEAADPERLIEPLYELHARVFRRLLASTDGRPLAVPLSGGYDSRLIAVWLAALGAKDVTCYTYGLPGNWESAISRELAAHLGFRWTFVRYDAQRWRAWAREEAFRRYFDTSGGYASAPHFQDWPAVRELAASGEIPREAIFVPGHSGDFLAGSHIPKWFAARERISRTETLGAVLDAHYRLWDWPRETAAAIRERMSARIEGVVGPIADGTAEEAADHFECWDCQERQAKFIVNSVRVYESFGHEWRLPLFDAELMDFWSRVPLSLRVGRRLYFDYVARRQHLPITEPNVDRGALMRVALAAVDRAGLRPVAKAAQRALNRARWRRRYEEDSPLGWLALVDQEEFRRRFTGREIGHAFFALRYLREVLRAAGQERLLGAFG
jgi:asparagine synthase (glutamine-hydrolysing)